MTTGTSPRGEADPDVVCREVLDAAVHAMGGSARTGQVAMAEAIDAALEEGRHLLVQAGTGTGKSLGYLAPALLRLTRHADERIVVATATLALQHQLASKDIPVALDAVEACTGRRLVPAILKGRTNYACRLRVGDAAAEEQGTLLSASDLVEAGPAATPQSTLAAEVLALREWADDEHRAGGVADRDDAPPHSERAWQQVSIPVRECLGVQQCPYGSTCFVERSREVARAADLVVTNHALLAIDAMHGGTALPEHSAVILDEAHELVARVTGAASAELSPQQIERVAKRALTWLDDDLGEELLDCADAFRLALEGSPLARIEDQDSTFLAGCEVVRAATRKVVSALSGDSGVAPQQRQAASAVKEVFDVAERMAALREHDVIWVSEGERTPRQANVAPLSVARLMRSRVFGRRPTILTSATLKLGGDFERMAGSVGLRLDERVELTDRLPEPDPEAADDDPPVPWSALDVGSPFDYRRQGILYIARRLPPPGRDGLSEAALTEIAELVWAAGGRTLGLFSSRRAAETAASHVRRELPKLTVLCQGDAQLSELTRRFVQDEATSLFGTLSLWQGVDVPGATCQLVIIDRIPFPRPDEPLTTARQRAVAEAGGNGFMAVAASQAALFLAQGSGRLIRRVSDRGMVAILDPRLVTARYGSFLRASMPDFWPTTDREVAVAALRRLTAARP